MTSNAPRQYTKIEANLLNGQHPIFRPHPDRGRVQGAMKQAAKFGKPRNSVA